MAQAPSSQSLAANQKPEIAPEIPKITSELAAQAALRAKEMLSNKAADASKKAPEIPARANPDTHKVPPEIPPKRMSLKKAASEQSPSPAMGRAPPPLPQKPSSVQNSPQLVHKFKDKPLPNSPQQQSGLARPPGTPQMVHKAPEKPVGSPLSSVNAPQSQPQQQTLPAQKPSNSPQFGTRNINSPQLNFRSQPQSATNSPQIGTKKPTPKAISPTEDFGSEDALRGIESGLRNMERAMQEQMNLRSLEAAAASQKPDNLNFEFKSGNIRSVGSITSLDGSSQNLKRMGPMEPQVYRGLERNLSMDQMRLDNFTSGNMMRSMESNPNIRTTLDEIKLRGQASQEHSYPREHHMRSLDRNLPLELQYSRHRSQDYPASVLAGDFIEQIRYQLATGGGNMNPPGAGNPVFLQGPNSGLLHQQQQQQQRSSTGLSREDLRLRRRSSHDETQFSQGGIPGKDYL